MPVTGRVDIGVKLNQSTALDLANLVANLDKTYSVLLASGTAAGQADKVWHDTRTLAASTTEDLDLNGATITDPLGAALAFVKVKGILVAAAAGNTNNVLVGGAAANAFSGIFADPTDKLVVRPGGVGLVVAGQTDAAGYPVVAGTGDLLRVGNSGAGTPVTYDIIVWGTSA